MVNQSKEEAMKFHVFKDAKGEWRWHLRAANGKNVASSGEGYKAEKDCLAGIELVKKAGSAEVVKD